MMAFFITAETNNLAKVLLLFLVGGLVLLYIVRVLSFCCSYLSLYIFLLFFFSLFDLNFLGLGFWLNLIAFTWPCETIIDFEVFSQ